MKPKLAFFSFASCEGCQLEFLNCEDEILPLLGAVEIVNFREAIDDRREDYDVAFVEGSITRPSDEEELKKIRDRAEILVAFGACASTGGVNRIRNNLNIEEARKYVYGDRYQCFEANRVRALDEVVEVDYYLRTCPASKREILELLKSLLFGREPLFPNYPICVECKLNENVCVYQKGLVCLGPVTRAGCEPICPSYGNGCYGCRGLIDEPNINAALEVLEVHGLTLEQVTRFFTRFHTYAEEKK